MNSALLARQTGHSHLHRLLLLRNGAILAQLLTLALVDRLLDWELHWLPLLSVVAALAGLNLLTGWRLRREQPVSNLELLGQLGADVLALSVLLYYAGGSTNPFVSLFLLPLVIAAATLPAAYTWAMAALTTASYTLLLKFYLPLPIAHPAMDHDMMDHDMSMAAAPPDAAFNMHVLGMWLGFVLSVVVIAYFVVKMAEAVRARDETLAKIREETLRNERIVAVGLQAASAAHEMGTPLSTLAVVIGELQHEAAALPDMPPEWQENLHLLDGQVRNCRRILDKMLANAQDDAQPDTGAAPPQAVETFLRATLDEWQLLRPSVPCHFAPAPTETGTCAQLPADTALRAALLNLLNNAADASPDRIDCRARWDARELMLEICDYGQGFRPELAPQIGSAFFTTKQSGHGLGLFLANASIERLNGTVRLLNRDDGATTVVTLPLCR